MITRNNKEIERVHTFMMRELFTDEELNNPQVNMTCLASDVLRDMCNDKGIPFPDGIVSLTDDEMKDHVAIYF